MRNNQKNLVIKTTKTVKNVYTNQAVNEMSTTEYDSVNVLNIYIHPPHAETQVSYIVFHTGTSGKQSSHDMHELHDDTGTGPGKTGLLVGRHRPIAATGVTYWIASV